MNKIEILNAIISTGIVSIIRIDNGERAIEMAKAIAQGGIKAIEVTFTLPSTPRVLEKLATIFSGSDVILGAGTVLDPETARIAILSGADFIVSPHTGLEVIKMCNRYQKAVFPAAMTCSEIIGALEAGGDIIKIFPATIFGPAAISAILGPLPYAPMMPTGGVNLDNLKAFIKAGAVAVGMGTELTKIEKDGSYDKLTKRARTCVELVKEAREEK